MHELMEIARFLRKEMDMAESYAYEAAKHKAEMPELAHHYYKGALEHLVIADMIREGGHRMVDEHRRMEHEDHAKMHDVWAFECEMAAMQRECVQRKLEMYKG